MWGRWPKLVRIMADASFANVWATRTQPLRCRMEESRCERLDTVTRAFPSCNHVLHMINCLISRATTELRDGRQRKTGYGKPKVLASRLRFTTVACQRVLRLTGWYDEDCHGSLCCEGRFLSLPQYSAFCCHATQSFMSH